VGGTDYPGRELIVALPVRYLDDRLVSHPNSIAVGS